MSESSNIHRIVSVLSSIRHLTQLGCNVTSCFCNFWYVSNRGRWSWQCRSSSSRRSASNAAILMSSASADHSVRLFFACNALIKSSSRATAPGNSTSLARPGERISLSNPLALSVVKGSQRLCKTPPSLQPFSRSRAHKDVERFSFHKGHQHRIQLICQRSQSVQSITTSVAAFASVTVTDSLSTAHVKTSLAPECTITTKFSVRRAQDTNSLSVLFSGGGFPSPLVSTRLHWFVLDLLRPTLAHRLFAQGTVASLTRLGRSLVADFAVVALAVKAWTRPCC